MLLARRKTFLTAVLLLALAVAGALVLSDRVQWRAQLVWMKVKGDLVIMSWDDVRTVLKPGKPARMSVKKLLETGNPLLSNFVTPSDSADGYKIFKSECSNCHGVYATGRGTGPDLTRRRPRRPEMLFRIVGSGIPGTAMTGVDLPDDDVWRVVAYLIAVHSDTVSTGLSAEDALPSPDVSYARLLEAREEPRNWLTYSGTYDGHRHSGIDLAKAENIQGLRLRWIHQLQTVENVIETTPIVVDGIMYLTEPPNNVLALDAATGKELWRYEREVPRGLTACCGKVNRGLAVLGNRLYMGTLDAHLISLDATTGKIVWDVTVADYRSGHSITSAPLAVEDKIVIGIGGGEFGIRGFLNAYDAETGERRWRFWTVPEPGEPGHETWAGDSWRTGGAPTWMTGSFDPDLRLIYWGVGNPSPPWNGDVRAGDNLYSNSVIALDVDSGTLKWHFQFTPHDEFDWDATQIPVLVDASYEGSARKLMLWANRNAFYYVLDRETGEFLLAREFAYQTWADGIDDTGRPRRRPLASPTSAGTIVYPGGWGATNWWSPSFSPNTGLFYVPTVPRAAAVFYSGPAEYRPGASFFGSGMFESERDTAPALRALRPMTGELAWEYVFPRKVEGNLGGVLSTAGDLVFAGAGEVFVALNARTGRELWRFEVGGKINAAPISYLVNGVQHVTISGGRTIFTFALDE